MPLNSGVDVPFVMVVLNLNDYVRFGDSECRDLTHNNLNFLRCRDIGTNRAVFLSGMADGNQTVGCRECTLCISKITELRVDAELLASCFLHPASSMRIPRM